MFHITSYPCFGDFLKARRLIWSYAKSEKLSYFDLPHRSAWLPIYKGSTFCGCALAQHVGMACGAVCLFSEDADCKPGDNTTLLEPLAAALCEVPAFVDLVPVPVRPYKGPSHRLKCS